MRWYRINSVRSIDYVSHEFKEHVVSGRDICEAFARVGSLGWYPLTIVASAWTEIEV